MMRADPVLPGEMSSSILAPAFRVVLWNRPARPGDSWFCDEWQVEDVHDVRDVIEWAEAQGAATFEVLVRGQQADDPAAADALDFTRVVGSRPDVTSTSRVVRFTSAD